MTIDDIIDLIDLNSSESEKYSHLLNAMNDWPTKVDTVSEYYLEVKHFLKIDEVNLSTVQKAEKHKKMDIFKSNAWNLESVSELILFLKESIP
jgi:hypothetical protein